MDRLPKAHPCRVRAPRAEATAEKGTHRISAGAPRADGTSPASSARANTLRERRRLFAIPRDASDADSRAKADGERAILRVFAEWGERENGRLPKIPTTVEELVRFHCLDYERRARALAEDARRRTLEDAAKTDAIKPSAQGGKASAKDDGAQGDDNSSLHTDSTAHRRASRTVRAYPARLRVSRKSSGRRTLSAPTATHYRRLNMLIDLAFAISCEEGVRETMMADVAARRGERRTTLYYVDRRAYLAEKRKAKLAVAAVLGLL